MDLKQTAISIAMFVFVLSSMIGMGVGLRVAEIVAPLRNLRLVLLSLVANFVVMPFAVLALARILRLDESMGIGLLLLGLAQRGTRDPSWASERLSEISLPHS